MAGITTSLVGCNSGTPSTASIPIPVTSPKVYLHSAISNEQPVKDTLINGKTYSYIILDNDAQKVLVSNQSFTCTNWLDASGCAIDIPQFESGGGTLSLLIYNGKRLVAASYMGKNAISLGLNHVRLSEYGTGEYLYKSMMQIYQLDDDQDEISDRIYTAFGINPGESDSELRLFIMLSMIYNEIQDTYPENSFMALTSIFDLDDEEDWGVYEEGEGDADQVSKSTITSRSALKGDVKFEDIMPGTYLSHTGDAVLYNIKKPDGTVALQSVPMEEFNRRKASAYKRKDEMDKLLGENKAWYTDSKKWGEAITAVTPLSNVIGGMFKISGPVSEQARETINLVKGGITLIATVGNIWLPGASSALGALVNGIIDGISGPNAAAAAVNPNAGVEAILNEISEKMNTVNVNLLKISTKLSEMSKTDGAVAISGLNNNIENITEPYSVLAGRMRLELKVTNIESIANSETYLDKFIKINKNSNLQVAFNVFNSNDSKYMKLTGDLDNLISDNGTLAIDKYLQAYKEVFMATLDEVKTSKAEVFTSDRNVITVGQGMTQALVSQQMKILRSLMRARQFYLAAAYLKYQSEYRSSFASLYLGKYNSAASYDVAVKMINNDIQKKADMLDQRIGSMLKLTTATIVEMYQKRLDSNLKKKFESDTLGRIHESGVLVTDCKPTYLDVNYIKGLCKYKAFDDVIATHQFMVPYQKCDTDTDAIKFEQSLSGTRMYCSTGLNYWRVDNLASAKLGTTASREAVANFIAFHNGEMENGTWIWKYYNRVDGVFVSMNAENDRVIKYESFTVTRNKWDGDTNNSGRGTLWYRNRPEGNVDNCLNEANEDWGLRINGYSKEYYYLFAENMGLTTGSICPGGFWYDRWYENGKTHDWRNLNDPTTKGIHQTIVDIVDDKEKDKEFSVPIIVTQNRAGLGTISSNYYQHYYTTLACKTSDCIVLSAGGNNVNNEPQYSAKIGFLQSGGESGVILGRMYILDLRDLYSNGKIEKKPLSSLPKASSEGTFMLTKTRAGTAESGGLVSDVYDTPINIAKPAGKWLKECKKSSLTDGVLAVGEECKQQDIGTKQKSRTTLDWYSNCETGSPIDVGMDGSLVCRYPLKK